MIKNISRCFICVIILFFNTIVCSATEDTDRLKLRVAVLNDFPPQYSTSDSGNPEGFAVDVIQEIAGLSDFNIEFVVKENWSEMFEALRNNEVDLIPNQGITKKRRDWFAFTSPVETFPVRYFIRSGSNVIQSEKDIKGKKIGVVRLNVAETILAENPDVTSVAYDHLKDAFFDLLAGTIDAIAFPEPVLNLLARNAGLEDRIEAAGPPLIEIKRCIAVHKDNTVLLKKLDSSVDKFVGSKAYQEIYSKWYGKPEPMLTIKQLTLLAGLLLISIIIVMAFWRYQSLNKAYNQLEQKVAIRTRKLSEANALLEKEAAEREKAVLWQNEAVRAVSVGLWDWDLVNNAVYFSPVWKQQIGYEDHEIKNEFDEWKSRVHPEDLEKTLERINKGISGEKSFSQIEFRLRHKDGSYRTILAQASVLKNEQGRPVKLVGSHVDITERKKIEQALKDSEKNMASVLNSTEDPVVRVDRNSRHIFANPALYETTGLSPKDYIGKTNEEIGMPEDLCSFWRDKHKKILETGEAEIFEFSFVTANKGERIFQSVVNPEFNEAGEIESLISFMRDITDLKQVESEKNDMILKLEQALSEVKTLQGLIPICANCKKIRDDTGYWNHLETYIQTHSEASFSHGGMCPECSDKLYGKEDWYVKAKKKE